LLPILVGLIIIVWFFPSLFKEVSPMEAQWVAQRAALRCLVLQHPEWTRQQLAAAIGRSVSFVKKWLKRFYEADPNDLHVLFSRSRARHTPPPSLDPRLVQRVIEIRMAPPENLQRTPGPRTILYYLKRDPDLQAQGVVPPTSTRTIWKILRKLGFLLDPAERTRKPSEPRDPLQEVQTDFKDITTVPPDPEGKRQHMIETLNFVDAGTSTLLSAQAHGDFHAETALDAVVTFLRTYGLPAMLTFDRDPRWVGSASGRDFPSPFRRFLLCLGIQPNVCPPQRPDKNAFVERYHRSYNQECIQVHRPTTLQEVREVTEQFMQHYNYERPHQGRSCQDQPPRVAFPTLPKLPAVPETVDPDRWLESLDGHAFPRRIGSDGCVEVDEEPYYIKQALAGQHVVLLVNASEKLFEVYLDTTLIKHVPIKGLHGEVLPFDRYVRLVKQDARSEQRRKPMSGRSFRQLRLWT
jgi:transposase InsO family protein